MKLAIFNLNETLSSKPCETQSESSFNHHEIKFWIPCPRLVSQPDKDLLREADGVPRPFCALLQGLSVIWQRQYGAYSFQGSDQNLPTNKKIIFLHIPSLSYVLWWKKRRSRKSINQNGNNLLAQCTTSLSYNQRSWLLSWGRWVRIQQTVKSTIWLTRWNCLHFQDALIKKILNISDLKAFFGQVDVDGSGLIEFHEFVKFIVRNYFSFSTKS